MKKTTKIEIKEDPQVEQRERTVALFSEMLMSVFRIDQKTKDIPEAKGAKRHIEKIKDLINLYGVSYHDPIGEKYNSNRTDVIIDSVSHQQGIITEVFSPIMSVYGDDGTRKIIKKGEVTVKMPKKQQQ